MVNYTPINAKTILTKHRFMDDWFLSKYGMNLYRGCEHACGYCDGRAEKYRVEGEFGEDVYVKVNAIELLKREIPKIKEKTFIFVGGGVGDSYQPAEKKFRLTRRTLELLKGFKFPIHILTKSSMVERDFDIIREINEQNGAIVSFSISSLADDVWKTFEPGASPPAERFKSIEKFSDAGIPTGVMFIPQIPFLSDDKDSIRDVVKASREAGADFILYGGMTLKEGRQKEHFMRILKEKFPYLEDKYRGLYKNSGMWGSAAQGYYSRINRITYDICREYKIPTRIPYKLFKDRIELKYEVAMILAHIGYFLEMQGKSGGAYKKASISIQKSPFDVRQKTLAGEGGLRKPPGVGKVIGGIVDEIVKERRCRLYGELSGC